MKHAYIEKTTKMANDKQKQFRFEVKQYMSEHRELSDAQVVNTS